MEDSEREALEDMLWTAAYAETSAWALLDMPWIADDISTDEKQMVDHLTYIDQVRHIRHTRHIDQEGYAAISERLLDMEWVVDGVSHDEAMAVGCLKRIIGIIETADSAARLIEMPFLQTLEQSDVMALDTLFNIAFRSPDALSDLLAHPQFKDGITDGQATALAMLSSFHGGPWLIANRLDLANAIGSHSLGSRTASRIPSTRR